MAKFIVVCGIRIAKDFAPETFGRLTSIGHAFMAGGKNSKQVFECVCGNVVVAFVSGVKQGNTTSCGCYQKEASSASNTKHGLSSHPIYGTWVCMISRCYDLNCAGYKDYGGRGITVCDRWRESFANFLSDMGERPKGWSIDRIDNNKGYCPENCRWATSVEQNNNTRRNRILSHDGKTQTMTQWAMELGFSVQAIYDRLRRGWSVERALSEPVNAECRRKATSNDRRRQKLHSLAS